LYRRLSGAQEVWALWRRENLLPLLGIETQFLSNPALSLVAISSEISSLPDSMVFLKIYKE
jgi:hypothetical protein